MIGKRTLKFLCYLPLTKLMTSEISISDLVLLFSKSDVNLTSLLCRNRAFKRRWNINLKFFMERCYRNITGWSFQRAAEGLSHISAPCWICAFWSPFPALCCCTVLRLPGQNVGSTLEGLFLQMFLRGVTK